MILKDSGYASFLLELKKKPLGYKARLRIKLDSRPSFHHAGINELKICNAISLYACDIVNKISKVCILTNALFKIVLLVFSLDPGPAHLCLGGFQ